MRAVSVAMDVLAPAHFEMQGGASESDLEKMIHVVETSSYQKRAFISQALAGQAKRAAKDPIWHLLMCSIVEHLFHEDIDSMNLIHELVDHAEELFRHPFGSRVIGAILSLCENVPEVEQRAAISELKHRIVEKTIDFIDRSKYQDRKFLAQELTAKVTSVAKDPTGNPLVCHIIDNVFYEDVDSMKLIHQLVDDAEELCHDTFGSRVIRQILALDENVPDFEQKTAIAGVKQRVDIALRNDLAKQLFRPHWGVGRKLP